MRLFRLRQPPGQDTAAQRATRWLLLAIALTIAIAVQWQRADLPLARELDANLRDAAMIITASNASHPRVAIVDIDEDSLKRHGNWPWPRARLAELAERLLSDEGAALVVFDLVLTDADRAPDAVIPGDARLVAIAQTRKLVGAQAFDYAPRNETMATGAAGGAIRTGGGGAADSRTPASGSGPAATATGYIGNFGALSQAPCVGNIGVVPDSDGRVRRVALLTQWQGQHYPTLALAALLCLAPELDAAALAARLPVSPAGWWAVPFRHQPESWLSVPAASVLANEPLGDPARPGAASDSHPLAGRVVLVGSSALGLADRVATPLSSNAAGVTVHAAALAALMDLATSKAPAPPARWLMPLWLVISIVALWWSVNGGRLASMLAVLALVVPTWAALAGWLAIGGSVEPVSAALWGYAAVLLLHLPAEWSWSQARVRSRNRLLSRYVAKPVLDELFAAGKDDDPLTPRRAEITVLIADMQDYTRLTNHSDLAQAAQLTKGFLAQLTLPVLANRGTLDRYTGDGLVAFWGAPIADEDHADRAIEAALAIVANVASFNEARAREGLPQATVRMGIASGSALVGDLGTPFRIAYTAVGDCINLASRLQQASRQVDVNILVSGSAASRCRRHTLHALGTVPIRGLPDEPVFTT